MVTQQKQGPPIVAGSKAARDYVAEQRQWFASRGIPEQELSAYLKGVEDGYLKALAMMQLHGVIKTWH